jgi:hypothetical protein
LKLGLVKKNYNIFLLANFNGNFFIYLKIKYIFRWS